MLQRQGRLALAQRFLQFCVCAWYLCKSAIGWVFAGDSCCDSGCVDVSEGELSPVLLCGRALNRSVPHPAVPPHGLHRAVSALMADLQWNLAGVGWRRFGCGHVSKVTELTNLIFVWNKGKSEFNPGSVVPPNILNDMRRFSFSSSKEHECGN